ncbi:MAG: 5-oxoprolinase, partial [Nitrospirae bacterium]
MSPRRWHFAIDRGGTFTDVVAIGPDGRVHLLKLLSKHPSYRDPAEEAIKLLTGQDPPFQKEEIGLLRLGTTVATNALLERKGGSVLLVITEGFRDLLRIGYQQRRDLFSFCDSTSQVLWKDVCEVPERLGPRGEVVRPLDEELLRKRLRRFSPQEFDAVALLLVHSWRNPEVELKVEAILKEMGFRNIYPSHRVSPEIKAVPRGNATVVDAYLGPVINQ